MSEAKKKKKPIVAILLIIIVLLAVGGGFFAYKVAFDKDNSKTQVKYVEKELVEKTLPFEEFAVNLADEGGRMFMAIKLTIAYPEANKDLDKELTQKLDKVQDVINTTLRQKKSVDFEGEKLEAIKKELLNKINDGLTSGRVTNVYVTKIVIQGS